MSDKPTKPTIPADELAKLRTVHGEITAIESHGRVFGIIPAPEAIVDRIFDINYAGRIGGTIPKGAGEAYANAAALSVVYPPAEERDAIFRRYRGLQQSLGLVAYGLASGPAEEEKKEEPTSSEPPKTT